MSTTRTTGAEKRKTAGLFDIRAIIGMLLGIYGVVLVIAGLTGSESQLAKTDGFNLNLWTGVGLLVAAAVFGIWTKLRPTVVE